MSPQTFDLRVRRSDGVDLRAVTGARWQVGQRNRTLPPETTFRHETLGDGWAGDGFSLEALTSTGVTSWDLEIGDAAPDIGSALALAVGPLLPEQAVEELIGLATDLADEPMPWHAEWVAPVGPGLTGVGASWFDVLAPSVNWRKGDCGAEPVVFFRHARLVWAPDWCVTIWSPRSTEYRSYQTWGLPDRDETVGDGSGHDGPGRLAAVLRAVLKHIEWSVDMVDVELESWDNHFLEQAATAGGLFVGPDLGRLQRQLASLGNGIAFNREAIRTLVRRGEVQSGFPGAIRGEITDRCERIMTRSQQQRDAVRQSFDLIASATAGQQFHLAQERADRDGAFQAVIALLAAVFVAPGLIAAYYGANVQGLPGYESRSGLWFMIGGSIAAALISLGLIGGVRLRSRRRAARRE